MRHTTVVAAAIAAFGLLVGAAEAQAQLPPEAQIRVGIYVQAETEYSSLGTPEDGRVVMDLNRARPRLDVTVNDWIQGRLETDFGGGRARIRYAYVDLGFSDAFHLRAGQFKKAFGLVARTSSSLIPVIQRPARISGLDERFEARGDPVTLPDGRALLPDEQTLLDAMGFQSYAVGAAVHGSAGRLEYEVGAYEGPSGAAQGGVAARAVYLVTFGLKVGAAVSHNRITFDDGERDGTVGALELQWNEPGLPGFGVLAEAVRGSGVGTGTDFGGFHVIGWLHRGIGGRVSGIEPLVRFSTADPDTDGADDAGSLLTAGFNVYLGGRNRLMLNWDVFTAQNEAVGTESSLRAQAQVYF